MQTQTPGPVSDPSSLSGWLAGHAEPFTPGFGAAVPGLTLDRQTIVGVAVVVRSGRQLVQAGYAVLATLVRRSGFRAVLIEGTEDIAPDFDRYVTQGVGDPVDLAANGRNFLRTRETVELLEWLRSYALAHPEDPVRVVHDDVPARVPGSLEEIEKQGAARDLRWHERTGQRIVHLGGTAHMIVGRPRSVSPRPGPQDAHDSAGARLRRVLGPGYAAIAVTAGSGRAPFPLPSPDDSLAESAFAAVDHDCFILNLHADPAPPAEAAAWLARPLRMRCVGPEYDPTRDAEFHVDAGPLVECVDRIVHVRDVEPVTLLSPP